MNHMKDCCQKNQQDFKAPDTTGSEKRIARNTIYLYIRTFVMMIVSLYTSRVTLQVLGEEDFGIYNLVAGFVVLFGFLNYAMERATLRFLLVEKGGGTPESMNKVFNVAISSHIMIAGIVLVLAETIGLWYVNAQMEISPERLTAANWIFQFSIISLIFVVLQIPYSAAILAYERMDFYAIISIVDAFIKLAFTMLLPYLNGDRLVEYGFMIMAVSILNFICYYLYCHNKFPNLRFNKSFNKQLFKSMLQFSGWNVFGSFAYVVKGQGVNVLLNAFFGVAVNAANGIAMQVSSAIQTFASNLIIAFKPQLTQSYAKGDYERAEQLMFSMSKISYVLMSIIAIPIMIEMDYVLNIWLKGNIPGHTATFTILTIIAIMIGVFNTPVTQMIHASGQMKKYQLATSIVICSILPISWIFLKLGYGATSVFIITILIVLINQVVCLQVLHSIFKFSISKYIKEVIVPCILVTTASLFITPYISKVLTPSIWRFIIVTLINLLIVGVLFYLSMNSSEKQIIKSYIHKIKNKIC